VDLGVVSDPRLSMEALAAALEAKMTPEFKQAAEKRTQEITSAKEAKTANDLQKDEELKGSHPLQMAQFASVLARHVPEDVIIFDEALTSSPAITRHMVPTLPGHYFVTRGGSLGVGFPGAIGAKLAHPDKTVIGFSGDGGSMYTIQALWSAVRHGTGAKFVVCNNGSYKLLQLNIDVYWQERDIATHNHPLPFDLSFPAIRFDLLAQSMGVEAVRVEKEEEIGPAIERMMADDKPFLIDLVLEGDHRSDWVQVNCSH
ncbi:MAG: thiamine pyrophosphate-binding protein, partial [Bacteroidetes bacterium]|nr:thiamine pyrophosphate-binding protein [Bacteroidota bacterium]